MINKIGFALIGLLLLLTLVSFLLPKRYNIERSTVIKAPITDVFQQVNDFKNWQNWSTWTERYPNLAITYGSIHQGKGATMHWTTAPFDDGEQQIVAVYPTDSLLTNLSFTESGTQIKGKWVFKALEERVTKVNWINTGTLGNNPIMRYVGLTFERRMGADYAKGLANLKAVCEKSAPKQAALTAYGDYELSQVAIRTSDDQKVLTILDTVPTKVLFQRFDVLYQELFQYVTRSKGKPIGGPLMIYHDFTKERAIIEVGIPIIEELPNKGRMKLKHMEQQSVAMIMYRGKYNDLRKAHEKARQFLEDNKFEQTGPEWEFFVTSPQTEKDPKKWTTIIHYPI